MSKPFVTITDTTVVSNIEARLTKHFSALIDTIGEDGTREGLKKTPQRAAKAFMSNLSGYTQTLDEVIGEALFSSDNDEMVIVKRIEFYSYCEHHVLPFFGHCHIGYVPKGHVLGLSKLARIVDMYAKRLQIQETLTMQIARAVQESVQAKGVGVVMEAQHLCMMMRGVAKQASLTTTSCNLGVFRQDAKTRGEFLHLVRS